MSDANDAPDALASVASEMDRRYTLFTQSGVRDIVGYNGRDGRGPLPYLVVVVDDLADVVDAAGAGGQEMLCRLAELARATGIHLVVATGTPRQDVVTDRVRRGFPTRLAFAVRDQAESRAILEQAGAERLVEPNEALFLACDAPRPTRLRLALVSDGELAELAGGNQDQDTGGVAADAPDQRVFPSDTDADEDDVDDEAVYERGVELAERLGRVSVALLQRRLGIEAETAQRLRARLIADGVAEAEA